MRHDDSESASRRLIALAAMAATAATIAFSMGAHPTASGSVSSYAPVSTFAAVWSHDDSVPNTADTLSHERLADEEAAPSF